MKNQILERSNLNGYANVRLLLKSKKGHMAQNNKSCVIFFSYFLSYFFNYQT